MNLSSTQLSQYQEQGFVELGSIIEPGLLAQLHAEEARFRSYPQISLADRHSVLPDTSTIFRNQLANYSQVVREFFLGGPHLPALRQVLGPVVCGAFTQFVTKLPDTNARTAVFPWHQDNGYGSKTSPHHVTVWCALDDVDEQNGCVWVMPGSHRQGLLEHTASGTSWHIQVAVTGDGVPARLRAGEAIAFSGFTLHRSLANHTAHPRRAFFMEYSDFLSDFAAAPSLQPQPLWLAVGELPYPGSA